MVAVTQAIEHEPLFEQLPELAASQTDRSSWRQDQLKCQQVQPGCTGVQSVTANLARNSAYACVGRLCKNRMTGLFPRMKLPQVRCCSHLSSQFLDGTSRHAA